MPHKIFVHSNARVAPAHSTHSDFSYQLAAPIEVPQSKAFVDQVHIPNEFPTIHAAKQYMYIAECDVNMTVTYRKVALTANTSYDGLSLAAEITTKLNVGTTLAANSYTCTFDTPTRRLTIANSTPAPSTFSIWPAEYLKIATWNPGNHTPGAGAYVEHDDCYDVIGFTGSAGITGAQTSVVGQGHINITPYHTLYIHSSLGTQADSVGPMGSSSVIRTVCLDQPIGRYVHDRNSLPFDYVSVAKGMIRQLDFKLTDWRGRAVPLTNSWSFSLIFVPEDEI